MLELEYKFIAFCQSCDGFKLVEYYVKKHTYFLSCGHQATDVASYRNEQNNKIEFQLSEKDKKRILKYESKNR